MISVCRVSLGAHIAMSSLAYSFGDWNNQNQFVIASYLTFDAGFMMDGSRTVIVKNLNLNRSICSYIGNYVLLCVWDLIVGRWMLLCADENWAKRNHLIDPGYDEKIWNSPGGMNPPIQVGVTKAKAPPAMWFTVNTIATELEFKQHLAEGRGVPAVPATKNAIIGTTCIECGFDNPYIDAVENYICRQCKIRKEQWT